MPVPVVNPSQPGLDQRPLMDLGLRQADIHALRNAGVQDNVRAAYDALKNSIITLHDGSQVADLSMIGLSVEEGDRVEAALMSYPNKPEDIKSLFGESQRGANPEVRTSVRQAEVKEVPSFGTLLTDLVTLRWGKFGRDARRAIKLEEDES